MHILLCDDSPEDLDAVATLIDAFYRGVSYKTAAAPYSLSRFSDPMAALSSVEKGNAVDVAILDIMMPRMKGVEMASRLRNMGFEGHLVFLTMFNDFATQSYAVKAFSYLLKPVRKEQVAELLQNIEESRRANGRHSFPVTSRKGTRLVLFSELMYAKIKNHQLFFYLQDGEILVIYAALQDYSEVLLREPQMLKPHKSFIVNMDYVRACENSAFLMRDGRRISVPKDFETLKERWLGRVFG